MMYRLYVGLVLAAVNSLAAPQVEAPPLWSPSAEPPVVFRSDVSLLRMDAQVLDRNNRTIPGLRAEDFILREDGKQQEIRDFSAEKLPVDVILLLDVSGSMEPHVERIASAAHQPLQVLGLQDRIAILVFDRYTRVRMPFRTSHEDAERGLERVLDQESFDGGTDITRGLVDAANYMSRYARANARRAIVVLTDDQTELDRDESRVSRALARADCVLSALIAPDALHTGAGRRIPYGGSRPGIGPGGNIIVPPGWVPPGWVPPGWVPPGWPFGARGFGAGPLIARTQSAGTSNIARDSGGDSMAVGDASAFEDTLARIRERYALHFYLPEGVKPGEERAIEVELSDEARRRYPGAQVRYRRSYLAPGASNDSRESDEIL